MGSLDQKRGGQKKYTKCLRKGRYMVKKYPKHGYVICESSLILGFIANRLSVIFWGSLVFFGIFWGSLFRSLLAPCDHETILNLFSFFLP